MDDLFILVGLISMGIGVYGLIKGQAPRLRIASRKTAGFVLAIGFGFLMVGGAIAEPPKDTKIATKPKQKVESAKSAPVAQKENKPKPKTAIKAITATVTRVIDGDTIEVKLNNGIIEKVRLIGVDTPETKHPSKPIEPYGKEASAYTTEKLSGKTVYLELDVQQRDKYGRLLAYVWLETPRSTNDAEIKAKLFNAQLLLDGYAQLMTIPPNVKYVDRLTAFQHEARTANKGLWGIPDKEASAPTPTPKPTPAPSPTPSAQPEPTPAPTPAPEPEPAPTPEPTPVPATMGSFVGNRNSKKLHNLAHPRCQSYVRSMKESNKVFFNSEADGIGLIYRCYKVFVRFPRTQPAKFPDRLTCAYSD